MSVFFLAAWGFSVFFYTVSKRNFCLSLLVILMANSSFLFRTQEVDLRISFNNMMTCYYERCKVVQKHGK